MVAYLEYPYWIIGKNIVQLGSIFLAEDLSVINRTGKQSELSFLDDFLLCNAGWKDRLR